MRAEGELYVGGEALAEGVSASEGKVRHLEGNVLELNGYSYEGSGYVNGNKAYGIYAEGDWTFVLDGDNSIALTGDEVEESYGIHVSGKLTIVNAKDGDEDVPGSLSVTAGASYHKNAGIYANEMELSAAGSRAVNINANGGTLTADGEEDYTQIIGIYAVNSYVQESGTVIAKGGTPKKTGSNSRTIQSYGLRSDKLTVTGGSLDAEGGRGIIEHGYVIGTGIYQSDKLKAAVFADCTVTARSGDGRANAGDASSAIECEGEICVKKGAKISATASVTTSDVAYGLGAGPARIEGGEIYAGAFGATIRNTAFIADDIVIAKGSNAVIEAEAGAAILQEDSMVMIYSEGINTNTIQIEEDSGATVTATAATGDKADARAFALQMRGSGSVIKSGNITATATAGNSRNGSVIGMYCFGGADIRGGKLVCTANGINFSSAGIAQGASAAGGINISGGEVTAVADLKGQTAKRKEESPNQCLACGIYIESGITGYVTGGKLTARGGDLAVYNYGGGRMFNGAVLYASEDFTGRDEKLLPVSAYDIHRGSNQLSAYKYIRSEAGVAAAPACEDVDMVQRYNKTDLSVDLSDTFPADAGIVRYVTNAVDSRDLGIYEPVITDEDGNPTENTTVSDVYIDQETGILTATIDATPESAGDIITFPVSVRSSKYATVLRNVIVTISDKDGGVLSNMSQQSICYGETLPAPVYTKPDAEGTESFRYSGTLDDGTEYPLSATAPDQAGHYTVKVTYETADTRYIGKADFVINPLDIADAVVTLAAEQNEYDGTEKPVLIESVKIGDLALIKDADYEISSGGTATEIENTLAVITALGNNYTGTKSFTWHLKKLIPQLTDFVLPGSAGHDFEYDYTGEAINIPAPVPAVNGMGKVTMRYKLRDSEEEPGVTAPTLPGTYLLYFDVAEGSRYKAKQGFEFGNLRKLVIKKLPYPGNTRLICYVESGRAQTGVRVTLPEPPGGGRYSLAETQNMLAGVIVPESISIDENDNNTLIFSVNNVEADSSGKIKFSVSESELYTENGTGALMVTALAAGKSVTGLLAAGDNILDGVLAMTYGDENVEVRFTAATPGESPAWTCTPHTGCVEVTSNGATTGVFKLKPKKVGRSYITVTYSSSTGIGNITVPVSIAAKQITAIQAVKNKVYDGNVTAEVQGAASLSGVVDGDDVSVTLGTPYFEDKDVGTDKNVIFDSAILTGVDASKYRVSTSVTSKADITPAEVNAYVSAHNRSYEKDKLDVELTGGAVAGALGDDRVTVDVSTAAAVMDDANAGNDKNVTVSGVKLSGADAGNYTLAAQPTGVKVNISKAIWADNKAQMTVKAGENSELDLTDYIAPGVVLDEPFVSSGRHLLKASPTVIGTKLNFCFKEGVRDDSCAKVIVSANAATNYSDYEIEINLWAEHKHRVVAVPAKAATCTEAGNIAYYRCKVCGELYSDEAGTNVITAGSTVIAALGHSFGEWKVTKEATTKEEGIKTRTCTRCGETETMPISKSTQDPNENPQDDPQNVPAHQHTLVHHARIEATEEAEGSIEYWECSECKKLFADEAATKEITAADIVIAKLIPPTKILLNPEPLKVMETIGDGPVTIETSVSYPKAVTWTGSKITKGQLAVLAVDGEMAKVAISGLNEAVKTMKPGTDVSKLIKISYSISKEKEVSSGKAYFTVKLSLKSSALKKAGIKGADKKALQQLVKKLNEQLKNTKYTFDIVPLRLKDCESISIKAKFKNGALQVNEDGSLKGLKSLKIKVKIAGVRKTRTFSFTAKKAAKEFGIKTADAAALTVDITATGKHFEGERKTIPVTK
ncbi:MAG: hypothetical protein K5686_06600 [Lachnospiraceae bacterium]|nr:hypothetical protein [Lachnospiraceae bacterium]